MFKSSNSYKILSIIVILVYVIILFRKIMPLYGECFAQYHEYHNKKEEFIKHSNWQENVLELKRSINRLSTEIKQTNLKIPERDQLSLPLQYMDSLIVTNKISLEALTIGRIDSIGQYQNVHCKLELSGYFEQVADFIKALENAEYVLYITGMEIKLESLFQKSLYVEMDLDIIYKSDRGKVTI